MNLRSVRELDVANKTVLVRTGFDVRETKSGVNDDFRIKDCIPTINYLIKKQAKILIIAHTGRPTSWDKSFSLLPVAEHLASLFHRKFIALSPSQTSIPEYDIPHVYFFPHNLQEFDLKPLVMKMRAGDIAVLENLRFYPGEKAGDLEFAKRLAALADVYVNEAFSNSHRDDASMTGIPKLLTSGAGLQLEKEVSVLTRILKYLQKPLVVMVGGVKLADKADALVSLAKQAGEILLGGGVSNLFLKILGYEIGKSVSAERGEQKLAKQIWRDYGRKIKLPRDLIVSRSAGGEPRHVKVDQVKPGESIFDIGPETIREYSKYLKQGKTLIWSGPMGFFERKQFSHGTLALGRLFASRGKGLAFTLVGGGDTLEAIALTGMSHQIDHISTGGGAMLEFLAGKELPGLKVLEK